MKKIHHYRRRFRIGLIRTLGLSIFVCAFLLPSYVKFEKSQDNYFVISYKGMQVGTVASKEQIDEYMIDARRKVVAGNDELVMLDVDFDVEAKSVLWGQIDSKKSVVDKMVTIMSQNKKDTLHRSYTVKINETTVNLSSYDDVHELLTQSIAPYDQQGLFRVDLTLDPTREVNVFTAQIQKTDDVATVDDTRYSAGVSYELEKMLADVQDNVEKTFDEYFQGLIDISYADKIEVIEAYLLENELTPVSEAIDLVTKEQETQIIYKVVSGDSLSKISLENNVPVDELIAMNPAIEDEFSTIHVDQEILINVPEPDLSIIWQEEQILIEDYEAEVQYVPNDDWYTTQKVTLQAPSAGRRKVVAVTTYKNGVEQSREILKEKVYAEAVPKIVERGTKIPPTYVKPIYGGRLSSGFGARSAPTKGASTNHQGVDWAVAIGTPVVASNGGTVAAAGWMSGYGYAVFINHADGRQTRYGHLSKVLVSPGQQVSQGQKIALSGNSGRSTGPHLHFEIRVNGRAVNPLKNLN